MKHEKGQDIVEFALLLPVFILILTGIIYVGFLFGDYMTLNDIARTAARETAVMQDSSDDIASGETKYKKVEQYYDQFLYDTQHDPNKKQLITILYLYERGNFHVYEPGNTKVPDAPKDSLTVDVVMKLNRGQGFVNALENLGLIDADNYDYEITYHMYDEYPSKNNVS